MTAALFSVMFTLSTSPASQTDQVAGRESAFNGVLRLDIGMNGEQVIAAYETPHLLPFNPGEPTLEITWNRTDYGSRMFHRLQATATEQPYTPGQPGDYDSIFLIDDQLISYSMVRWSDAGLFDDFVTYFVDTLRLGDPAMELAPELRNHSGIFPLSENGMEAYWVDDTSGDILYLQFTPKIDGKNSNVRVGLSGRGLYDIIHSTPPDIN